MGGALGLCGLIVLDEYSHIGRGRKPTRNRLTEDEVLEGDLTSPSLFTVFHNAETVSAACSRLPSTKALIFISILVRVASVESSTQIYASCSTYRLLISSYLHHLISVRSTRTAYPAYLDANLLNDSSTMSHLDSSSRILFSARVFNAGTSYCREALSGHRHIEQVPEDRCWPYPRVDRWTLGTAGGPCLQMGWRFLYFETCGSPPIQTAQNLSHPCRDTSKKLGTCNDINEILR